MENQEQERRDEPSEAEREVPPPGREEVIEEAFPPPGREEVVREFPDPGREEWIEKGL